MEASLKQYFGFSTLRHYQRDVIQQLLSGHDCLVVMATGGGRSLCYQLPPMLSCKTAIVVSPLLSLMQDQVMSLNQKGIKADYLASSQSNPSVAAAAQAGHYNLLYMTPEKAMSLPNKFWSAMLKSGICLLAVDEAHCISEWGHDFRMEYKKLHRLRDKLKGVPFVALTATATQSVRADIHDSLSLKDPFVYIGSFDRPNIYYGVKLLQGSARIDSFIGEIIDDVTNRHLAGESTIIYCATVRDTEQVHEALVSNGIPTGIYHGQMDTSARQKSHRSFVTDEVSVMVATIAFGMGIDKPDVRCVIHFGCPKSLESYYQESGRCGRDGLASTCLLYYSRSDFSRADFYCSEIKSETQKANILRSFFAAQKYCSLVSCRREELLNYFGQISGNHCGNCDNCKEQNCQYKDVSKEAILLLTCIKECGGQWGLNMPINVLRGSNAKKIRQNKYDLLEVHGAGRYHSADWWKALGDVLLSQGLIEDSINSSFRTIRISRKGLQFIDQPEVLVVKLPTAMFEDEESTIGDIGTSTVESSSPGPEISLSEEENQLYQMLIEVRKKLAHDNGAAPYAICSDQVIRQLSKLRPSTMDALSSIDGVTMNFVNRFGVILIDSIEEFSNGLNLDVDNFGTDGGDSSGDESFFDVCSNTYGDNKFSEAVSQFISLNHGVTFEEIRDNVGNGQNDELGVVLEKLQQSFDIYQKDGIFTTDIILRSDPATMSINLTDSDSSPVEVDSSGAAVVHLSKSVVKSSGSSHRRRRESQKHGSTSRNSEIDCTSLVFMSSQEIVSDVTARFDATKKEIVESIGFGGLLHLPGPTSYHKSFSLWLLRNVKWLTGAFCFGGNANMILSSEHIGKVIGLNHSGIDVLDRAIESTADKSAFIQSKLSFLQTSCDIVQAAQSYVEAATPEHISECYVDNFKVAFVIFAMGRFLAPCENAAEGNYDFWGALAEPAAIDCYNWSGYVLSSILESARKINWDILYNRKIAPICCCTLILQVFFLDNVDFGTYNLVHNIFPRVKHYSSGSMLRLIECCKTVDSPTSISYGRIETLRTFNSCYYSPSEDGTTTVSSVVTPNAAMYPPPRSNSPKDIRKRTLEQATTNNPPSCGVTPVINNSPPSENDVVDIPSLLMGHYHGQYPPELLECMSLHQARCFNHVQSFSKSLRAAISKENASFALRIIELANKNPGILAIGSTHSPLPVRNIQYNDTPVRDKFKLNTQSCKTSRSSPANSSGSWEKYPTSKTASCKTGLMSKKPEVVLKPVKLERNTGCTERLNTNYNLKSPEPTFKFAGSCQDFSPTSENRIFNGISLSARQINSMKTIDLDVKSFAEQYSSSPITKKIAELGPFASSHWSLGSEEIRADPSQCASFFHWISTSPKTQELDRLWLMHDSPRFIQVEGYQLCTEFVCNNTMTYSVFDLIIRRLKQLDNSLYSSTSPLCWRHMFESDFAMHALGDDQPWENIAVREQFTGIDVDYELCRCRMIFVPVHVNDLWWVYVFDMQTKSVVIMDPSGAAVNDENVVQIHCGTIDSIKHNLSATISVLFSGWNPSFDRFNTRVFRMTGMPFRREQSGFLSLFFIAHFEGTALVCEPSQVNLQKFKEYLLYEMLDLKGNRGRTPAPYIHVLD